MRTISILPLLCLLLLCITSNFPICSSTCNDTLTLSLAFKQVSGYAQQTQQNTTCHTIHTITFPSGNLTGSVSWSVLTNLSSLTYINLWNNSLQGSIPTQFFSIPSLQHINLARNKLGGALRFAPVRNNGRSNVNYLKLSRNRFTSAVNISYLDNLQVLDLSYNKIGTVPGGLRSLHKLERLDLSHNWMHGRVLHDLPPLMNLKSLNLSYNNFTGEIDASVLQKFGKSAFINAGNIKFVVDRNSSSSAKNYTGHSKKHQRTKLLLAIIIPVSTILILSLILCTIYIRVVNKRGARSKQLKVTERVDHETGWLNEAKWTAPVVMIEKPLMQLTFAELAAAASGFGRESQLAERGGRSGAAYRAVLPGDLHVVIRVVEGDMCDVSDTDAVSAFWNLGQLRHRNILPLLGYCISGREKLLIYEYMERGDLHRWLHELPAGAPTTEEWDDETLDISGSWPARHHIVLGIARGLAFLHQGWAGSGRPVTHGHLVLTNILLGDDLEPRIADVPPIDHAGAPEDDVYQFGLIIFELMTCRTGWDDVTVHRVRGMVKEGKELDVLDERLLIEGLEPDWQRQMAGCLHVGYLCTAQSPDKRPTMQQVVGLVKDIRPASVTAPSTAS